MKTGSNSFIDKVAIAFAALVFGFGAALVASLPLLLVLGVFYPDLERIGPVLFWKLPISVGIISGLVALFCPDTAANWLGKISKGAVYLWRAFSGR